MGKEKSLSIYLSRVLRHDLEMLGLEMDCHGMEICV